MKLIKNVILTVITGLLFVWISYSAPAFNADWMGKDIWYTESFEKVSSYKTLKDNIRSIFFPDTTWKWGKLFDKLRIVAIWLAFLFIVRAWAMFVLYADDESELKKAKINMVYIIYWAFLIFWAAWILWKTLNVWSETNATQVVSHTQNGVIWTILIFLKSFAYYLSVILMIYYWYSMMSAQEKEDKIKAAKTWVLNIILALIAIKILDYIYLIAQNNTFVTKWSNFILWTWKILWWILWVVIILALLYSAVLLISSRWNEESWKKAKTIVTNVFLVIIVLFMFIVIVFDLFKNFSS